MNGVGTKRRWTISGVGAAAGMLVLLALFRPPALPPSSPKGVAKPPVTLNPGHSDELTMRDLTPLFLPTPFNAAPALVSAREPDASFSDPKPKWKFSEQQPALPMPAMAAAPAKPVDALADVPSALALGIGRTDLAVRPAPAHGAYLEIFAGDTGAPILSQTLPASARPTSEGRDPASWHPLEFVAAVDLTGVVGPVTLTASSGTEEVDDFFRNYLVRSFRLGDRLSPGFYRVVVGP